MPRYYFDCLSNGVLYGDEFGCEMPDDEVADQAQAIVMSMITETLPNKNCLVVIVTVRAEQGQAVYVAHGTAGGHAVKGASTDVVKSSSA